MSQFAPGFNAACPPFFPRATSHGSDRLTLLAQVPEIPRDRPVLIAGPTASGKSALAMEIAARDGGVIVNADAAQVFDCWRIVTARPEPQDEAALPHALYGHVAWNRPYSAGHWLRDVLPLLRGGPRPIIVGGTGLYFLGLTEGMADIPATPPAIRAAANARDLEALVADLDAATAARIDLANPARVRRAWEVLRTTGRGLAAWQDETPPPALKLAEACALVIDAPKPWLTPRIERRFDQMIAMGALDEVAAMADRYD
ncbi:MAG: tRNA (adenosine(37)-N6)-dimethylallyltransferase MiaA, partial [Rhodobacteraceae bacterium]